MKLAAMLLLAQMQIAGPPVATIGQVDGDSLYTLSNVYEAHEDRRGNLYVVQQRIPYVAVFDSLGTRVATLGRKGEGPGEFGWPTHLSVVSDTIYISDRQLGKIAVYSPEFQHVRDIFVNDYPVPNGLIPGVPLFVTEDGFVANLSSREDSTTNIVFQPWRGSPTILDQFELAEVRTTVVVPGHMTFVYGSPLPEVPLARPAAGTMFLFRPRPTPTIREFTPAGWGPTRPLPFQTLKVPSSVTSEWIEKFMKLWGDEPPAPPDAMRRAFEDAATLPEESAFVTLRTGGPDGDIWVEHDLPGRPLRMVQVTEDGNIFNSFDVPEGAEVLSVRAGHVWLLELDQYDVPFLRRHRLVRSGK
jgi:hypothetical protein